MTDAANTQAPEEAASEEIVDPTNPEVVDLSKEVAQHFFDRATLYQTIQALRGQLAQAKINTILAQAGVLGAPGQDLHPNKFREAIERARKAIDLLMEHAVIMEGDKEYVVPEPSKLAIATADLSSQELPKVPGSKGRR